MIQYDMGHSKEYAAAEGSHKCALQGHTSLPSYANCHTNFIQTLCKVLPCPLRRQYRKSSYVFAFEEVIGEVLFLTLIQRG